MKVAAQTGYKFLPAAVLSALKAGEQIMEVYQNKDLKITLKNDETPVTQADMLAHDAILTTLINTGIPVLSEEGELIPFNERKNWKRFWMVDPLDGTKEFIDRSDEFTVNVALIDDNVPVLGVIYIPVEKKLYFGNKTSGAYLWKGSIMPKQFDELLKEAEKIPAAKKDVLCRIVASRNHLDSETADYMNRCFAEKHDCEIIKKGSSIKFCMIAEGSADIYPRFSPVMEWDVAAGNAIVAAAGGRLTIGDGVTPLTYNTPDLKISGFIATAGNYSL